MNKLLLITAFALLAFGALAHKHNCVHERISSTFKPVAMDLTVEDRRERTLAESTRPLKIVIDDSNIVTRGDNEAQDDRPNAAQRDLIVNKLVPVATRFLSRRLTVASAGIMKIRTSSCYEARVNPAHQTAGIDADLVIYVTTKYEPDDSYIAWATACVTDPTTGRPTVGQINYNLKFLNLDKKEFEEQIDTTLHEITHILAFSPQLYPNFRTAFGANTVKSKTNYQDSNGVWYIQTPKVLETARKYFNCPTLTGVALENEGSSGSAGAHWERAILHNEEMTASSIPDASYSEFTLSLLYDSGWYQVDFSRAEPMFFGKGAGCNYVNSGCKGAPSLREWCSPSSSAPICTFNFGAKGYCREDQFSSGCAYATGYSNAHCNDESQNSKASYGETYGPQSKCIIGNINKKGWSSPGTQSLCYKYQCSTDGRVTLITSTGEQYVCSRAGESVRVSGNLEGTITCPDPALFCQDYYPGCPGDCSQKGYCVRGTCECRAGYGGNDCNTAGGPDPVPNSNPNPTPNPNPNPTPADPCTGVSCPSNGYCSNGVCNCYSGYEGASCSPVDPCKNVYCGANGRCSNGVCTCSNGYTGSNCQNAPAVNPTPNPNPNPNPSSGSCSQNCNGKGICVAGTCSCYEGFSGSSCEVAKTGYSGTCPNYCNAYSNRGTCNQLTTNYSSGKVEVTYSCKCKSGWSGADCATLLSNPSSCPNNCGNSSAIGTCNSGKCQCTTFYVGNDCSQPLCPGNCNNKGQCNAKISTVNGVSTTTATCNCPSGTRAPYCLV